MVKVKVHELRTKNKGDLLKQLTDLKQELLQLRVAAQTGGAASKLTKIKIVRKSVARVFTVLNQKEKTNLKKLYKNKTFKPLDLRSHKTRAQRKALQPHVLKLKTRKTERKLRAHPLKKYFVKLSE